MRRLLPTVLALLATPTAAHAALPGPPPTTLPGDARDAAVPADRDTWIVGTGGHGAAVARIARRFGAEPVGSVGAHVVERRAARAFAAALRRRGLLAFAEPNRLSRPRQTGTDPFTGVSRWRSIVVEPGLEPPPSPRAARSSR